VNSFLSFRIAQSLFQGESVKAIFQLALLVPEMAVLLWHIPSGSDEV